MSEQDYSWGGSVQPRRQLFNTWLSQTRTLQESAFGTSFEDWSIEDRVDWTRVNVLAATDELHEALSETSWKPWQRAEYFHREAFLGEIVDALHFVANLCVGAEITDQELEDAYLEKMARNRARQASGYTGTDKCDLCKRAVDDVVAHGGTVVHLDGETICDGCWDKQ